MIIPVTTARKPKRSASGYGLYVQKHITDVSPTTKSMQEIFKDAAVNWRTLPEHEKQVSIPLFRNFSGCSCNGTDCLYACQQYSEDAASLREQRAKESLKWFDSIDPRILKEINRRRVARGKSRFRKPKDPNAPKINRNPFLLSVLSSHPLFLHLKDNFQLPLRLEEIRRSGWILYCGNRPPWRRTLA